MRLIAFAGFIGPVLFMAVVVFQGMLYPDYSHIEFPISALAAWPHGWIQNVSFVVSGLLLAMFSLELRTQLPLRQSTSVGSILLTVSGSGLILDGIYPWRRVAGELVEPPGHIVGSLLAFVGAGIGFIVLSRSLALHPAWSNLAGFLRWSGILILVLFAGFVPLALPDGAPFHPWAGLWQRIVVAIWFAAIILLSLRWLRNRRP